MESINKRKGKKSKVDIHKNLYYKEADISEKLSKAKSMWELLSSEDKLKVGGYGAVSCYIRCFYIEKKKRLAKWNNVVEFNNFNQTPYAEDVVKWLTGEGIPAILVTNCD